MKALKVSGKDAAEFLHRVFASQVKKIPVGGGNRGLLLSGQSKMVAQFDVLRIEEKIFWLVAPEECFPDLMEEIERLHFAEELNLEVMENSFQMVPGISSGELEFSVKESWPAVVPGFEVKPGSGLLPELFHFERIAALVPWPKMDWDRNTNALEAGVLPWIDRYKGCYPGQEVVEKSLNIGHPARVLVAFEQEDLGAIFPEAAGVITSKCLGKTGLLLLLVRVPWKNKEIPVAGFKMIKTHF